MTCKNNVLNMQTIAKLLMPIVFMLFAFSAANAVVDSNSSIINQGDQFAVVTYLEGDTVKITPCEKIPGTLSEYSSTSCGLCTPPSCSSCRITRQLYNCSGTQIFKDLFCTCNESGSSVQPRTCREEQALAGTNPCGGNCSLCVEQVCSGGGMAELRGYLCKAYKNCPRLNFRQYRAGNSCGTESRVCCLTNNGLDWTAWSSGANSICPIVDENTDSEFEGNVADLNPGGLINSNLNSNQNLQSGKL